MSQENRCLSCSNEFEGKYCNVCGEKVIDQKDRRLVYFLGELVNAITFADSKLWRSVLSIVVKPGQMSHDYIRGVRRKYMRPLSFFFLANLIYFLFPIFNTFNTTLYHQTNSFSFLHSSIAREMVNQRIETEELAYEEFEVKYNAKTTELSKLLLILMVFLSAMVFWVIHIGSSKKLLADHLTISLELMTYTLVVCMEAFGLILIGLKLIGLSIASSEMYTSLMVLLLIGYFVFYAERNFYEFRRKRRWVNTIVVLITFMMNVFFYRAMLFFVTFWLL